MSTTTPKPGQTWHLPASGNTVMITSKGRDGEMRCTYVEIRPTAPRVDPGAMKVNGLDLDHLRAHGRDLQEALEALSAWVREQCVVGTKPVFVGHNAPFE